MSPAPRQFSGSWVGLYHDHIERNLPPADEVGKFHEWLLTYCQEPSPVFPVRTVRGLERRKLHSTGDGTVIALADNSLAWAVHASLVGQQLSSYGDFRALMTKMPTHMFDVAKLGLVTANSYGWYVAHICPAKNGDIKFHRWTRTEVERRCFLALHPCNIFLVPGTRNSHLGEDLRVIAFFAQQYAVRYGSTWREYLKRVNAVIPATDPAFGHSRVELDFLRVREQRRTGFGTTTSGPSEPSASSSIAASYRATRLNFRRDLIEALQLDEQFEVVTPFGTFRFTKRDFYASFSNIIQSSSYRDHGSYHGKNLHLRASKFRVPA